jgi:hypothetical protein
MAEQSTAQLVLHFEVENKEADLQAIKAAIDAEFARADGVAGLRSEVLKTGRFIDPLTVGAIIVTVTVAVKETSSLVDALNDLVESVKKLGTTLGVKTWMENRRKRLDIDANANAKAIAETAAANAQSTAKTT